MENLITAVIPARAGSRRLKNKNILPFADSNLLIHKIRQLKKVKDVNQIVVSSDSEEMLQMAIDEGVSIHKREQRFADEISEPFGAVVSNIVSTLDSVHVLWATCTCPLTTEQHYEEAIKEYWKNVPQNNDSLVSFEVYKRYLWDSNGPMNYKLGLEHVPSQQLPDIFQPTFGICLAPRNKMIEWKYFHGPNPYKFILDKKSSIDIDDGLDLACARAYYEFS